MPTLDELAARLTALENSDARQESAHQRLSAMDTKHDDQIAQVSGSLHTRLTELEGRVAALENKPA
jgi:uncharacterized coiled-coil protein SlyX